MNNRLKSLDILRGVIILLAFVQHYGYFLNVWGSAYLNQYDLLPSSWGDIHLNPSGVVVSWMVQYLTPYVSQLYLMLAAFNLGLKSSKIHEPGVYKRQMKRYAIIFGLFSIENIFVASEFGAIFTFHPLLAWSVILGTITTIRYLFPRWYHSVLVIMIPILYYVLAPMSGTLELRVCGFIGPGCEYDAQLEYFFPSALIGLFLGEFFSTANKAQWSTLLVCSIIFTMVSLFWMPNHQVNPNNILEFEHLFFQSLEGLSHTLLVNLTIVMLAARLNIGYRCLGFATKVLEWTGKKSLQVFLWHKVLFIYVIGPIFEILAFNLGVAAIPNNIMTVLAAITISTGVSFCLEKPTNMLYYSR
ncbi:hypothetical protein [Pseudobacteriovorax antillogorgiicola]|uniref:Acyltransferase family protein n=1 Tax=Pseudobacteriovorax antillogorgiicola TaxID=1513793 RepID=A0A1Y6C5M8_9BACT|nr:hypothetical protein [Pseudobacteriovorax antillogorgiicola]TCS51126.1 hypothetical protein EDD56_1117 [Pseudobacteriovorax antillogorgiicola]SMF38529.1 hypothetical protein SAMN06296036_111170 [Pseudobacteriovorax antillogorgiicola]